MEGAGSRLAIVWPAKKWVFRSFGETARAEGKSSTLESNENNTAGEQKTKSKRREVGKCFCFRDRIAWFAKREKY